MGVLAEGFDAVAKLTGAKLEAKLEAGIPKLAPGLHGFGGGLWIEVAGGRSWAHRYSKQGKARHMGLGPWPAVSLAQARAKVAETRELLAAGVDPIDERRRLKADTALARAKSITFDNVVETYIAGHEMKWRNPKHRNQWRATLKTYASPLLGRLPLADIQTDHVVRVLRPIWTTKPETAVRLRGRIETILAYGIAQGWCAEPNAARWHNHLQMILPARSKVAPIVPHPALDWRESPDFMAKLRKQTGFGARALEFVILTAVRSGEVRGATWDEVDLATRTWTIPAARMKAARPHRVPLSESALGILRAMAKLKDGSGLVFLGQKHGTPLSDMTLTAVLRRMGRNDLTAHGFRSTFRDWAAENTHHPNHVVELALAHAIGDKVEAAYRRGDLFKKRQTLMADWAAYLDTSPGDKPLAASQAHSQHILSTAGGAVRAAE